jgi:hypothetical protein
MSEPPQMTYAEAASLYETLEARAGTRRRTRRPRRRLTYAMAAGSCVAVVVAVALLSSGSTRHLPTTAGRRGSFGFLDPSFGFQPPPIGSDPFRADHRPVTVTKAARLLGAPVPAPNTALANSGNLSAIWAVHNEVILDYVSSQIRISIGPPNRILRNGAAAAFRKMARIDHLVPGALTIDGSPAIVVGATRRHSGFVGVVRDGLTIVVMGDRSAAQLIAIARSLTG